jgi:hypothetical protein
VRAFYVDVLGFDLVLEVRRRSFELLAPRAR